MQVQKSTGNFIIIQKFKIANISSGEHFKKNFVMTKVGGNFTNNRIFSKDIPTKRDHLNSVTIRSQDWLEFLWIGTIIVLF